MDDQTTPSPVNSSVSLPVQNPTPSPIKSKLPIIFITSFLLILFGIGGIFIGKYFSSNQTKITPSISPTIIPKSTSIPTTTSNINSGWKTYTDNKYFSIKYPFTWIVEQLGTIIKYPRIYNPNKMITSGTNGAVGATETYPSEFITIFSVEPSSETPKQIFEKSLKDCERIFQPELHEKSYSTNNLNFEFFDDCGEGSMGKRYIVISNGNLLALLESNIDNYQETKIENQILSTFKFTQ